MSFFMKWKRIICFVAMIVFLRIGYSGDVDAKEPEPDMQIDSLHAGYAILMDADSGRVLYEKNGYEQAPMASTTKIMTLLVALENGNLADEVCVSSYAAKMPKVHLGMAEGECYRLEDLLYSLMLESHNDTAVAIAEHIGKDVEGFADLMNTKAKELGAYHTHFVTPNGLDDDQHYTTAYDLALIARYAIQNDDFLKIVQTQSYSFHEQTTGRSFTVQNKDRFLTSYAGSLGIKTGFTGKAGYCFVGAARRDDKTLISVVLASGWPPNKGYKWKDTAALMDYGMKAFQKEQIITAGTTLSPITVEDSVEQQPVTPYITENVEALLSADEEAICKYDLPESLLAPVKKDQTIGKLEVWIGNDLYKIVPVYAKEERTRITYRYVLQKLIRRFCFE